MSKEKTPIEIQKSAILKAYRSAIRLKYSLLADEEIEKVLPMVEAEINVALQNGTSVEFSPGEVFDRYLPCE